MSDLAKGFVYNANPGRVVFGSGTIARLPEEVERLGLARVLVLATPDQEADATRIAALIGDRAAGVFAGARMHTPVEVTEAAMAVVAEQRIDGLVAKADALRATHAGTRIAVTEPVPLYLTDAAGLVDATPPEFSEAVEEDADPPAAVVAATLDLFGADPVRALLVNAQTRTPVTDQVEQAARAAGVPVVEVGETLPSGTGDYVEWINSQLDALGAALDRP